MSKQRGFHPITVIALVVAVGVGLTVFGRGDPADVGAKKLTDVHLFHPENQGIVTSAIRELRKSGEDPADFFAKLAEPYEYSETVLKLWHKDAFSFWYSGFEGDPSGKCRNLHFDKRKRVVKTQFWK